MGNNFVKKVEEKARIQFIIFDAEIKLEDLLGKVNAVEFSNEVKQKIIDLLEEMRPNLLRSVVLKEINKHS